MKRTLSIFRFIIAAASIVWLECSVSQVAGGGTIETTNGAVSGAIVSPSAETGRGTLVRLLPANYDPVNDTGRSAIDTTDSLGHYRFSHVDSGEYVVEAVRIGGDVRSIRGGIHVAGDTIFVPADTLKSPGSIKVALPAGVDAADGYVYIPGTIHFAFFKNRIDFVALDSVPSGVVPALNYSSKNGSSLCNQGHSRRYGICQEPVVEICPPPFPEYIGNGREYYGRRG